MSMKHMESLEEWMTFLHHEEQKVRRELRCMPRGCLMIQMKGKKPEFLKVTYVELVQMQLKSLVEG